MSYLFEGTVRNLLLKYRAEDLIGAELLVDGAELLVNGGGKAVVNQVGCNSYYWKLEVKFINGNNLCWLDDFQPISLIKLADLPTANHSDQPEEQLKSEDDMAASYLFEGTVDKLLTKYTGEQLIGAELVVYGDKRVKCVEFDETSSTHALRVKIIRSIWLHNSEIIKLIKLATPADQPDEPTKSAPPAENNGVTIKTSTETNYAKGGVIAKVLDGVLFQIDCPAYRDCWRDLLAVLQAMADAGVE